MASPRAAVQDFMRLTSARDYETAASYLQLPAGNQQRAAELASRLRSVIDQRLILNMSALSPLASGDTTDGDPAGDRVGVINGSEGREEPVRLVRVDGVPIRWVFSRSTVASVDAWYETLAAPQWVRRHAPPVLLHPGPLSLYWWQWLGVLVVLPLLLLMSWTLGAVLRVVVTRIAQSMAPGWDRHTLMHARGPFRLFVAASLAPPLLSLLELNARVAGFFGALTRGLALIAIFWALLIVIRVVQTHLESAAWQAGQSGQARTMIPLLGNFLRVALTVVALLVTLAQFGYPVDTVLAGIGIGGIALALAAQKTVENIFGSVSLAADKVFRVGDWVRTDATEGAVERIGLRSTSIRTMERTVVRVPNAQLAEVQVETFGERDRILFRTDLNLTYDTSRSDLGRIRDEIERMLREQEWVWQDVVRVNITAFTESAIRMSVVVWIQSTDYNEYLKIRHGLFLELMRIIEEHGASFALPSRTVYNVQRNSLSQGTESAPPSVS